MYFGPTPIDAPYDENVYFGTPIDAPYENQYRHTNIKMQFGAFSRLATFSGEQIGDTDTDLRAYPAFTHEVIDCACFPAGSSVADRPRPASFALVNGRPVPTRHRQYWTWRTTDGAHHPSVLLDAADHDTDQVGVDCGVQL